MKRTIMGARIMAQDENLIAYWVSIVEIATAFQEKYRT